MCAFYYDLSSKNLLAFRGRSIHALSNQVRGLLHEYGVVIALGNASLRKKLPELVSPENEDLTPMSKA
jgi:hypothetical protein